VDRVIYFFAVLIVFVSLLLTSTNLLALEKVRLGSAIKVAPAYYLPIIAGEEKGFWKQNKLEVTWIPFKSSTNMNRGLTSKQMDVGFSMVPPTFLGIAGGMPAVVIAELTPVEEFNIWVRSDSPIRTPQNLAGAKISVGRLGDTSHAYGLLAARALGLSDKVRFVGSGGIAESIGSLQAKAVDASVIAFLIMARLKAKGAVRDIARIQDYVPKDWSENIVIGHRQYIQDRPKTVAALLKAISQAIGFVMSNRDWSLKKMKTLSGFPPEVAKMVYQRLKFTPGGKINEKGLENVLNFMVEFGVLDKERKPPLEKLYTKQFTG
jgi:NitT/TauT family transport system substrate-binding protein